jgi:hypothetical protein
VADNYLIEDANGVQIALAAELIGADPATGLPLYALKMVLDVGKGTSRVATLQRVTNAATLPAGAVTTAIANVGSNVAVVAGANLNPGEAVEWDAPAGDTLGAIVYDATGSGGTTLLIEVLT